MSIRPFSRFAYAMILALSVSASSGAARPARDVGCGPSQTSRSVLTLQNHTDSPVYAYLDGKFVGCCEPFLKCTIRNTGSGDLQLVGRFRCDTWGPVSIHLEAGQSATYTLTESARKSRGGAPRPARSR